MNTVTQIVGGLLIAIGVIAYVATGFASLTALLPALLGLIILLLGLAAARTNVGHHALHAALVIALLGALGSLGRVGGVADGDAAAITSLVTVLVCAAYIGFGVRSFIAARKARQASA
ncbi:MAG: hypothetical protein WD178_01955 [Actinomycetota bacterium]